MNSYTCTKAHTRMAEMAYLFRIFMAKFRTYSFLFAFDRKKHTTNHGSKKTQQNPHTKPLTTQQNVE